MLIDLNGVEFQLIILAFNHTTFEIKKTLEGSISPLYKGGMKLKLEEFKNLKNKLINAANKSSSDST